MSGKPASLGALVMLAGGLLVYWALSEWELFGLQSSGPGKIMRNGADYFSKNPTSNKPSSTSKIPKGAGVQ